MPGVTPTGFEVKTQEDILSDVVAEERAEISPLLNVSSSSVIGQLNGILTSKKAEIWEVMAAIYNSFGLSGSGYSLRQTAQIIGIYPAPAAKSTVTLSVTLASGFTLPAGSIASVTGGASSKFVTLASVNNAGAVPATFSVNAEAEFYGPTLGVAGTITTCVSPTTSPSGWIAVTNPFDAVLGYFAESDAVVRQRIVEEQSSGGANVDAIRTKLLNVAGVLQAFVHENPNTTVDANGTAAHGISCVIYDGPAPVAVNTEVAQAIWDSKPAGIATSGATTANAVDAAATSRPMSFTRATVVQPYIHFSIKVNALLYPTDGDAQIKLAVATFGDANLRVSDDLILSRLCPEVFTVAGVTEIVGTWQSLVADPVNTGTQTNLTAGIYEVLDLDTSRITVSLA